MPSRTQFHKVARLIGMIPGTSCFDRMNPVDGKFGKFCCMARSFVDTCLSSENTAYLTTPIARKQTPIARKPNRSKSFQPLGVDGFEGDFEFATFSVLELFLDQFDVIFGKHLFRLSGMAVRHPLILNPVSCSGIFR